MKASLITILAASALFIACNSNEKGAAEQPSSAAISSSDTIRKAELVKIASFKGVQVTGVTVSESGRLFANFPRWRSGLPFSVVEILPDGSHRQYPDTTWNTWTGVPKENRFTCVQSVVAHGGSLFVLDPASPEFKGVVGNAVLYEFDLATNKLRNKWVFDKKVAPQKSYLNDLRVDDQTGHIYITDSGLGGIVVVNRSTGEARRLLSGHPSTRSEDVVLTIEGKQWLRNGSKPQVHSDGIELYRDSLYYHALTGYTLYRVPTSALTSTDTTLLSGKVESLGRTSAPDGMFFDGRGNLYMADLEKNAVVYRTPAGELKTLVSGPEVKWADTFTMDKEGNLYFTASRLHESSGDISSLEFSIYKIAAAR